METFKEFLTEEYDEDDLLAAETIAGWREMKLLERRLALLKAAFRGREKAYERLLGDESECNVSAYTAFWGALTSIYSR